MTTTTTLLITRDRRTRGAYKFHLDLPVYANEVPDISVRVVLDENCEGFEVLSATVIEGYGLFAGGESIDLLPDEENEACEQAEREMRDYRRELSRECIDERYTGIRL